MNKNVLPIAIGIIIAAVFLSGCGLQAGLSEPEFYIPPTKRPVTPTPLATAVPTEPAITATPECSNNLAFVDDVTVEDGTAFLPGAMIEKTWKVKNSGTCNWDYRYTLNFVDGYEMGAITIQELFPARADVEAELTVVFTAPYEAGRYTSTWQAHGPDGEPFGAKFYVDIIVDPNLDQDEGEDGE